MRLGRFLSEMNMGTRSTLKRLIRNGQVQVNGSIVRDPGYAVQKADDIRMDGERVMFADKVYLMLHKPAGVVTATLDKKQKTVLDLLEDIPRKDIFPVGRLDKDTEGLLLLTNDGELAHRLLRPASHVDKVYEARVSGVVTGRDKELFAAGLRVDEELTAMPAVLEILETEADSSHVRVTIREGKFHQIKRMFAAVGKEVRYLKRLSMGPLALDEHLQPGESRQLTAEEVDALYRAAGI